MPFVSYRQTSPYASTRQTSWYLDTLEPRRIPPDPSDDLIVVETRYENRPDLLSHALYGTPDYWWVFAIRNMNLIRDPVYDLRAGMQIMVPTRQRLLRTLT
jgi:hypothetical protein